VPASSAHGRDSVTALVERLIRNRLSVAVAESLTGGLVMTALTSVPGASAVVRGGVVAYATGVKRDVLGVDAALLDERGAVDADVAREMARGVRELIGADFGIATTGVAGPDGQDGKSPGVVFVAVDAPFENWYRELLLDGDREAIRTRAAVAALELLTEVLGAIGRDQAAAR
jgi:nicotinamide-nucleotide amidase